MTTFLTLVAFALVVAAVIGFPAILRAGGGIVRGLASGFEITRAMSKLAMWHTTVQTRPRHRMWPWSRPADMGVELGRVRWWGALWRRIYASFEAIILVIGPPGWGKTGLLALFGKYAPGALLAASTSTDILRHTVKRRRRRGPVAVFNPEGLEGQPDDVPSIRWDITSGCEDPATAIARAGGLISGASSDGVKDGDWWEGNAHRVLYCLLMAAALSGGGSRKVGEWAANLSARRPLDILRAKGAPDGWVGHLEQLHESRADKTVDSIAMTLKPVVEFLSDPSLIPAVTPREGEGFDAEDFIRAGGTLYLVASDRAHTPIGPLFAALTTHVHETAKRMGAAERLDPPLFEVLDEAALICRVPLQRWISDARKHGILIALGVQNRSQLRDVWGPDGADTIWNNATVKVATGAISDKDTLDHLSRHSGEKVTHLNGRLERTPVLTEDAIRRLPRGSMLVQHQNSRAVVAEASMVWGRRPSWARRLWYRWRFRPAATEQAQGAEVVALADHRPVDRAEV